jgi:two-component system LytT family response regulator
MIRVLIADDEPLARERIATLLQGEKDIEVLGECRNGPEAEAMIHSLHPDLVFLDIQMPGCSGLEVLEKLDAGAMPEIVFVTAYDQYTLQAFAAHAIDYLLKPFDNERFREMLAYARRRLSDEKGGRWIDQALRKLLSDLRSPVASPFLSRIPLRQNQGIRFVEVADLICCEAEGSYVRLFTEDRNYLIRENLGALEKKLDPGKFVRIHRSSLVRVDAIRELQSWSPHEWLAVLANGRKYIVSRAHRERLKEIMRL